MAASQEPVGPVTTAKDVAAQQCPTPTDLCVYRRDPIFCLADRLNVQSPWIFFAAYAVLLFAPQVLAAYFIGCLTSPTLLRDFASDLSRFPPFLLVPRAFHPPLNTDTVSSAAIPYLRDYVIIAITALMAVHMALLHCKWRNLSRFMTRLNEDGILDRDYVATGRFDALLRKCDRRVNNPISYILVLCLSGVTTATFLAIFDSRGIYSALNPVGDPQWEWAASRGWWGSLHHSWSGFAVVTAWLWFVLYYMMRHNVVGCHIVLMASEMLRGLQKPLVRLRPDHDDGFGGVGIIRTILFQIFGSVAIMGFALLLAYFFLPASAARVLMPLAAIFFLLNPVYLIVTVGLTNRQLRWSRNELVQTYRARLEHADEADAARIALLRRDLADARRLPTSILSVREIITAIVMYGLPVWGFVDAVLARLSRS
jgi:hypothetical protein